MCNNIDVLIMVHVRISEILHSFPFFITTANFYRFLGSDMKPKVRARAAELNAEPELFQFKANITYLIKSNAQKYHILRN